MLKKFAACIMAIIMAASCLSACGNNDTSSQSSSITDSSSETTDDSSTIDVDKLVIPEKKLVINGEEVDTDGLVMLTINDKYDVTFDQYRYFYHYILENSGIDFADIDEAQREEVFKELKDTVDTLLTNYYSYYALAEANNIEVTDNDKQIVEDTYQEDVDLFGSEEDCEKYYLSMYATSDVVKDMITQDLLYDKIDNALFGENGTYYVSQEDFLKFAETEDYAQVKHVLITYSSQAELSDEDAEGFDDLSLSEKLSLKDQAYTALSEDERSAVMEKAKIKIDEVLKKAESGDDFDELIKTYGWDPGMESSPEGYFITRDTSFVEQFIDAAFKLKEGEISGVVESNYGYHILKREPVDMDYVNENVEELYESYFSEMASAKATELLEAEINKMTFTYSDEYNGLSYDSIS